MGAYPGTIRRRSYRRGGACGYSGPGSDNVRGYPVVDFDQRVADVSVDHPAVAQNYRLAHDIALRHENADVGMEKLREAMLHYRALFADLLYDGGLQPVRQVRPEERERIRRVA